MKLDINRPFIKYRNKLKKYHIIYEKTSCSYKKRIK